MTPNRITTAIASCAASLSLVANTARAISLPDSGSCSSSSSCLSITNTTTGTGNGVTGTTSFGYGVRGISTSSGDGVSGTSTLGRGVYATSGSWNALHAVTGSSSVAAVAAEAPDSNGLAYWGTGGIIITGSAQKTGGGSWSSYSDARLKKDVKSLTWGLEELRQVRPVMYKYNGLGGTEDDGRVFTGVIAQELEKVLPYMVTSQKKKLHPDDANQTDVKVVDPSAFVYVLINSVKEQQEVIDRQERRIASLERARNSSLSASLVGGGAVCFAMSLLPLGFIALRRRKASK